MLGSVLLVTLTAVCNAVPIPQSCIQKDGTIQLDENCGDVVAVFGTVHSYETSFNISASELEITDEKAVLQIGIGGWTKNLSIWLNTTTGKQCWSFGREGNIRDGGLPLTVSLKYEAYDGRANAALKSFATVYVKDAEAQTKTMKIRESEGWKLQLIQKKNAQNLLIERLPIWFRMRSDHKSLKIEALGESKLINVCKKTSVIDCSEAPDDSPVLIAEQNPSTPSLHKGFDDDPLRSHPDDLEPIPTPAPSETFGTVATVLIIVFIVCIVVPYSSSFCFSSVMTAGVASVLTQDENAQMPRSQSVSRSITRTLRLTKPRRTKLPPIPPPRLPSTTTSNFIAPTSSNPTNEDHQPHAVAATAQPKGSNLKSLQSQASKESIRLPKPKVSLQTSKINSVRSAEPSQSSEAVISTNEAPGHPEAVQPTQYGSISTQPKNLAKEN